MMTQMTEQEVRNRTQEKMKEVQALCEKLQLKISARQRLDREGFVENLVVFNDVENYPLVEVKPGEGDEAPTVIPENKQPVEEKENV
jgi:hypothetical protein